MKFAKPIPNETFTINSAPSWPSIAFQTDAAGAHTWHWTIAWGTYSKSGKATSAANTWDAKDAVTDLGGTLTVRAEAGKATATIAVKIKGTNPTATDVTNYLAKKPNSAGFDKLIQHESKFKHFNSNDEPVKSFDNGFGMCQLTSPRPSFEQVWNWKKNIDGGLNLFAQKRAEAIVYLSHNKKRTYTDEQLKYESVCRWNGGSYHVWDDKAGWVRRPNILCDSKTHNIGWNMTDADNKGKTEAELRKRDSGSYSSRPKAGANWDYFGVCYADRVLG